jgi:hypothetical protein
MKVHLEPETATGSVPSFNYVKEILGPLISPEREMTLYLQTELRSWMGHCLLRNLDQGTSSESVETLYKNVGSLLSKQEMWRQLEDESALSSGREAVTNFPGVAIRLELEVDIKGAQLVEKVSVGFFVL